MSDPGLVILPTHRVVDAPADMSGEALLERLGERFEVAMVPAEEAIGIAGETDGPPAFGFAANGMDGCARITLRDGDAMKAVAPERSDDWRGLDLAVLHELILDRELGFPPGRILKKDGIDFVKDAREAVEDARGCPGRPGRFAFVTRATTMEQMRAVAGRGELMPQKSTYFYPKLTTGLIIRAMDL